MDLGIRGMEIGGSVQHTEIGYTSTKNVRKVCRICITILSQFARTNLIFQIYSFSIDITREAVVLPEYLSGCIPDLVRRQLLYLQH